jgi:hypothetical protein
LLSYKIAPGSLALPKFCLKSFFSSEELAKAHQFDKKACSR